MPVQAAGRAGGHHASEIQGALLQLEPVLCLLGRLATESPAIILEIVHNTSVASGDARLAGAQAESLATLVVQCMDVLATLPSPPMAVIGMLA